MQFTPSAPLPILLGSPPVTSLVLYVAIGLLKPENRHDRDALVDSLGAGPGSERAAAHI